MLLGFESGNGNAVPENKTIAGLKRVVAAMWAGIPKLGEKHGYYFATERDGTCVGCAVGTILVGAGKVSMEEVTSGSAIMKFKKDCIVVNRMVPNFRERCPEPSSILGCSNDRHFGAGYLAEHLFEFHRWSREQVAQWFEKELVRREQAELLITVAH